MTEAIYHMKQYNLRASCLFYEIRCTLSLQQAIIDLIQLHHLRNHRLMLASNPYNLPDKSLKQNTVTKPITLRNKKSRDRSYDFSKQFTSKGIRIDSHMKKSMNLQNITSSPNLHTPSTSSSITRLIQPPTLSRQVEYRQTHIQSHLQTQNERKIKFLFEKFYIMSEQINNHESILSNLVNEKDKDRNLYDLPFDLIGIGQRQIRKNQEIIRNQGRNFMAHGQTSVSLGGIEINLAFREIDQLKKQVTTLKQDISTYKSFINKQKQPQINILNSSKTIKLNSTLEHQSSVLERKFFQDFSRIHHTIEQLKNYTHEKIIKVENFMYKIDGNNQLVGQKLNKTQEKINNLESSIQSHMNIVNQEINNTLTKIVASINEKISKALENNVSLVNQKLKRCIETYKSLANQDKKTQLTLSPSKIEGKLLINSGILLKLSGYRAEGKLQKIKMKSTLTILDSKNHSKTSFDEVNPQKNQFSPSKQSTQDEEIVLDCKIYHIDGDGYLLDQNKIYLTDQNNNLLQLESAKLAKIKDLNAYF